MIRPVFLLASLATRSSTSSCRDAIIIVGILLAYFPSVAAGLRPSPGQTRGPSILKCGMAGAHEALRWDGCPMDPSTPHERQPETQSVRALACSSSGINVLMQLGVISLTFRDLGLHNMAPPWQSGPEPCPRQSFLLAFVRLAKGTPMLHPTVCGASIGNENYGAWPKLASPSMLWDGPGLPGLSYADDVGGFEAGPMMGTPVPLRRGMNDQKVLTHCQDWLSALDILPCHCDGGAASSDFAALRPFDWPKLPIFPMLSIDGPPHVREATGGEGK
ncbi:hypothetical protein BDP55DRAFT_77528 [Colletotrichum godetiae]|uniref:Uncharacterized protein n=1 Tax=Colletotrichum godetiae TaxID=1209918 RepID=A0AAJ0EVW9_9PEZI|nr:uncharacterized protein BDP55DRAFT_77528 [Colletotrichum godetiae]KAK1688105.1 hypothetical protein BDP55DRAFT_77528 [Colletotrichum godetiae]